MDCGTVESRSIKPDALWIRWAVVRWAAVHSDAMLPVEVTQPIMPLPAQWLCPDAQFAGRLARQQVAKSAH